MCFWRDFWVAQHLLLTVADEEFARSRAIKKGQAHHFGTPAPLWGVLRVAEFGLFAESECEWAVF